jgi:hypothetical protein
MLKNALISFFIFLFSQVSADLFPGFNKQEAKEMLALCNSFTFIDLYNSDAEIIPSGYEKVYTSGIFGMDNKFQIYKHGNVAVINFRGSTDKKVSWIENIYSSMIPARGSIKASGEVFNYCFAEDTNAAVHAGYALSIAYLANDIIFHIDLLNKEGIYDIILTGHSQGGAIVNMMRAYLEFLPGDTVSKLNNFKSYSFAAPMVGNKEFAAEYEIRFCTDHSSFNIVNTADLIPKFPVSYEEGNSIKESFSRLISEDRSFNFRNVVTRGLVLLFEKDLIDYMHEFGSSAVNQLQKDLGPIEMPEYVDDINYRYLEERIEIPPVDYPKMLKDSSILENDSLMIIYQKNEEDHFINDELYVNEPWTYQHKPYNYYVSFLKLYFPEEYALLEKKYLPENL